MSVELGLAVVATVDLCLKYGKTLVELCAAFKRAEVELSERVLRVEACWMRISSQLNVLREAAPMLIPDHLRIHHQVAEVLTGKLRVIVSKLQSLVSTPTPSQPETRHLPTTRKWKYAWSKESIDIAIGDLEAWQKIFDPSWYLIMRIASNAEATARVDEGLSKHAGGATTHDLASTRSLRHALVESQSADFRVSKIFLSEEGIDPNSTVPIPLSWFTVGQRRGSSAQQYILDSVPCPPNTNISTLTRNVRDFALKLTHTEPDTFGLLRCKGVFRQLDRETKKPTAFTFVFWVPHGLSQPVSLRTRLLEGDNNHSLSDRFKIATELAKSVSYVHMFGFVHKNLSPESVLLLQDGVSSLGVAFLAGFAHIRTAEGMTSHLGDASWKNDLYRHPRRQGQQPEQDYIMQHDIYSLGVCLLELGLWQSFVLYDDEAGTSTPSPALSLPVSNGTDASTVLPFDKDGLKGHLRSIARAELPKRMGARYTEIVETCLTCLDAENEDFGDELEFQDADGIVVGVRFIEKIIMKLNSIVV